MPLPITSLYAGLLALLLFALSMQVIRQRWRARVSLGDGGDSQLGRAIRAQGNFAEYVPMAVILLALSELASAPDVALHGLGGALLAARVMHAIGLIRRVSILRRLGTGITFLVLALGGAALVAHSVW